MAEVLFLQRGNYRAVDDFERFLDGTLFPFERTFHEKDENGKQKDKKVKYMVQGGRREYKIVGYAIPDEHVNTFLNGLNIGDGEVHPKKAEMAVSVLRKAMGAEKIPKQKERGTKTIPIPRAGVAVYMIGIKKDETSTWTDPETGKSFTQENL